MLLPMASRKEPKAEQGSLAWYVDIANPATGDDFVLMVKEAVMEDGSRFPFSIWASGTYPRELDGLLKLLSIDMRISDPAWIAMKLKGLQNFPEAKGSGTAARWPTSPTCCWPATRRSACSTRHWNRCDRPACS
jgi:ribonucleoside-diphosphate reductase alpha chain